MVTGLRLLHSLGITKITFTLCEEKREKNKRRGEKRKERRKGERRREKRGRRGKRRERGKREGGKEKLV